MDPLSLVTGILALLGACSTASKTLSKIRCLKRAPALLQALNNEIADLQLALMDINDYIERTELTKVVSHGTGTSTTTTVFDICSSVIDQTRQTVQEIEAVVNYRILRPGREEGFEVNRLSFLGEMNRLNQFQADLRHARHRITSLFSHFGMKQAAAVNVDLQDLRVLGTQTRTDLLDSLSMLAEGQARIENSLSQAFELKPSSNKTAEISHMAGGQVASKLSRRSVEVTVVRRSAASKPTCQCQRRRILKSFSSCLGKMFLGYTATPTVPGPQFKCSCENRANLVVFYVFPAWFLHRTIFLHLQYRSFEDLTCSLSIRQTLPHDHLIWSFIRQSDIRGMQRLLESGQLSPKAQSLDGVGLLHVC